MRFFEPLIYQVPLASLRRGISATDGRGCPLHDATEELFPWLRGEI